jgi:hypothetical protein
LNCDYVSLNHDVRPVQHLHEVAACDEQSDVTVPRGVHNPDVRCRMSHWASRSGSSAEVSAAGPAAAAARARSRSARTTKTRSKSGAVAGRPSVSASSAGPIPPRPATRQTGAGLRCGSYPASKASQACPHCAGRPDCTPKSYSSADVRRLGGGQRGDRVGAAQVGALRDWVGGVTMTASWRNWNGSLAAVDSGRAGDPGRADRSAFSRYAPGDHARPSPARGPRKGEP